MTNIVLIKRSGTANAVPTGGQLANGEIAINFADGNLFFKDSVGSVQTLASKKFVSVTGNITGGNVDTGIVSATGNVQAGNLNAAGLSLSSNVVSVLNSTANITTTANIAGGYFIGNGSQLTGITGGGNYSDANVATFLSNFGSNTVSTTGNVTTGNLTVNGNITYVNSNVVTINDKFINVANNAATSGAANGGGLGVGPVDAEYATLIFNNGTTAWNTNIPLSVNGNVTGNYFVGNGAALTSITGANVTGNVANATYAVSAGSAGSAVTAEQVTFAVQANITGVGTLGNLSVSGNTTVGNLSTGGFVSATGNVTGNYFIGDGSQLTGVTGGTTTFGNTAPVSPAIGDVWIQANTAIQYVYFNDNTSNQWAEMEASQSFSTGGGASGANTQIQFNDGGSFGASANLTFNNSTNTLSTTTISASGNLNAAGLSLSGNVVSALVSAANITTTANIAGGYILGNGSQLTGIAASYGNANVVANLAALDSNPVSTTGNVTGGNLITSAAISAASISASGNITGGNITGGANVNATTHTGTTVSVSGNITGGNVLTSGLISATGNITGGNVISDGVRAYKWTTQANTAPSNSVAGDNWYDSYADKLYLYVNDGTGNQWVDQSPPTTFASLTITGNTASGNLLTAGTVSATGNVTGGNILGGANVNATTHTGTTVSVSGNITGGNVLFGSGIVSGTGNVTGNVFIGNGSQLTGIAMSWSIANSNATMSVNRGYFVDTTGGAKTMTLPTGVTIGDTVRINDLAGTFGTNNLTVGRNSANIQGVADDLVVSVNQSSFGLIYSNGTYGWKLLEF